MENNLGAIELQEEQTEVLKKAFATQYDIIRMEASINRVLNKFDEFRVSVEDRLDEGNTRFDKVERALIVNVVNGDGQPHPKLIGEVYEQDRYTLKWALSAGELFKLVGRYKKISVAVLLLIIIFGRYFFELLVFIGSKLGEIKDLFSLI